MTKNSIAEQLGAASRIQLWLLLCKGQRYCYSHREGKWREYETPLGIKLTDAQLLTVPGCDCIAGLYGSLTCF